MIDSTRMQARLTSVYRRALWLLPAALRRKHGEAIAELFARELASVAPDGRAAVLASAAAGIFDLLRRASYERFRVGTAADDVSDPAFPTQLGDTAPPVHVNAVTRQLAAPFLTAFVVLTGSMLARYLLSRSTDFRNLDVFALSVPFTAALTIPMAIFVATLWVGRRWRAMSVHPVLSPALVRAVLIVSGVMALFTLVLTSEIVPRTNGRLASVLAGHTVPAGDRSMTIAQLRVAEKTTRAKRAAAHGATAATITDLREREANYSLEMHKKFVISASCIVLALSGLAIGWRSAKKGRSIVAVASIVVLGAFYASLMAAESLADQLLLSPGLAMWSSTVVVFGVVVLSLRRASQARVSLAAAGAPLTTRLPGE